MTTKTVKQADKTYKAMVIDDQATSRIILETIIQDIDDDLRVVSFDSCLTALQVIETAPPDIILADYKLPQMTGIEFTRRIRTMPQCSNIPVIIVTIHDEKSILYEALAAGATEFLAKPVDQHECRARCKNLLTLRKQQLEIKQRADNLELAVNEAVAEIKLREKETLHRLAVAGEYKDVATGSNLQKMGRLSRLLAEYLGMPDQQCEILEIAAPMHDIGKIGIPDNVLLKASSLTEEEMAVMKRHSEMGYDILKDSPSPYMQMGAMIALHHHEKFDGSGYPKGLRGAEIPLEARIATVADVFDALTSKRPYKHAWELQDVIEHMTRQKGSHFDPDIIDILIEKLDEILEDIDRRGLNKSVVEFRQN